MQNNITIVVMPVDTTNYTVLIPDNDFKPVLNPYPVESAYTLPNGLITKNITNSATIAEEDILYTNLARIRVRNTSWAATFTNKLKLAIYRTSADYKVEDGAPTIIPNQHKVGLYKILKKDIRAKKWFEVNTVFDDDWNLHEYDQELFFCSEHWLVGKKATLGGTVSLGYSNGKPSINAEISADFSFKIGGSKLRANNELTRNFFKTAYETLDFNSINVLKISDYNTTGLKGSSSGKSGTAWSRLVKESGTNDKDGVAGGSFGIGKSAYFACSRFRTVFFSSLSEDNEKSNIGVARLISFDLDNETKSIGMGFYAEGNKLLAIQDLADFDGKPKRTEYGTDAPRPPPFWNCAAKMRHARIGNRKRRPPEAPSRPCPARTGAGAVPPKRCCAAGARRGAYNR